MKWRIYPLYIFSHFSLLLSSPAHSFLSFFFLFFSALIPADTTIISTDKKTASNHKLLANDVKGDKLERYLEELKVEDLLRVWEIRWGWWFGWDKWVLLEGWLRSMLVMGLGGWIMLLQTVEILLWDIRRLMMCGRGIGSCLIVN